MKKGKIKTVNMFLISMLLVTSLVIHFDVQIAKAVNPPINFNTGFETGSLTPWTTQNNATIVTNNAHSGTYAVHLGGPYSGIEQTVSNLEPNTSYTLTAWIKTAGDLIYLGAKNFAGSGSEVNTFTTSNNYTQMSVTFTTGSFDTSVNIFIWKNDNTNDGYADEVILSATDEYHAIPGKVEAEDYIAMHGVQTETTADSGGGLNVGYIDTGDWMDYKVHVTSAGNYKVEYRVASIYATGQIQLESGLTIKAIANVPNTGDWQAWTTITANVNLDAGTQTIRVYARNGGFNLNWIKFSNIAPLNMNPGFETGSLLPWATQNNATIVTNNVHSGNYAVSLGGAWSGLEQTITGLSPNTEYTLTGWIKSSGDLIYMGVKDFAGVGSEVNTHTTETSYTQLSVSFTTDNMTTSAYLFLWKNDHNGDSYVDDLVLIEATKPPFLTYSGQDIGFNTQDPYWQNSASLNTLYDAVVSTGVKWVRATLFWDLMEQTQGTIDWAQSDLIFDTIKAKGLKVVLVIRSAPSWAAGGADTWQYHNYAPFDDTSYGIISYEIAKRYLNRGVEIVFELGNEQNMEFFNMPVVDPEQYTKNMLIPGATGIRNAAAELGVDAPTILVGGFSPVEPAYVPGSMTPFDFMTAIYDHGGQGYFDSIAYHPYTYVSGLSSGHWTFVELQKIIDLMDSKGDTNRKVWATEVGWATGTGEGMVSEAEQATFTEHAFDFWFSLPYAGPMLWYELIDNVSYDNDRENTFGLLFSTTSWPEKPAYSSFISKISE